MNAVNSFRAQLYLTPCGVTIQGKKVKRKKLSVAKTSSAVSAGDEARQQSCVLTLDPRPAMEREVSKLAAAGMFCNPPNGMTDRS